MKNRFCIGLIVAGVAGAAWANYEWQGATGEWSASAANWWDGSALVPWTDGSYAEMKPAGEGVATDVIVDAGGVTASTYEQFAGATYSLGGGPLATPTFSVNGNNDGTSPASLTIGNAVTAKDFYFRGTVSIANGGSLTVGTYQPMTTGAAGVDAAKVVVQTGGTLEVTNFTTSVVNNYSTLYVDGGLVKHALTRYQDHRAFSKSHIKVGPNGMHVGEAKAGQTSFMPYPVEGDDDDGGLWVDTHSGYYIMYGNNTYKGGLHLTPGGKVGIQSDSNLGMTPTVPMNSITYIGDGTTQTGPVIVSHSQGTVTLGANRDILIGDNVMAQLSTYSASSRLVLRGAIDCVNRTNGVLNIGGNSTGPVVIETSGGRTNHLGRLFVTQPLIIGNGTILLENTTRLERGKTGSNDESWGVNNGSPLNISGSGHLMVTGGVLKAGSSRNYQCNSGQLTISQGGVVDMTGSHEFMHGYNGPATTTVRDGGQLRTYVIRMAGDSTSCYNDATKSVLNVDTGGVLHVEGKVYIGHDGRKGTLNFNGGILEWAAGTGTYLEGTSNPSYTRKGLMIYVKEGGMVVSNNSTLYVGPSLRSGAAQDGGITKWGSGEMALWNPTNTFTGAIRVMQGSFATFNAMTNAINTNCTVCLNSRATFRANLSYHTFARIEGSGSFVQNTDRNLTVWQAIAPGMGTNTLGTLTVSGGPINIADGVALEIDVDAAGNSDCFSYQGELDLSKMSLRVNDLAKLNSEKKYVIASNLMDATGDFASSNLPNGWLTRYDAAQHKLILYFQRGTVIMVR